MAGDAQRLVAQCVGGIDIVFCESAANPEYGEIAAHGSST